MILLTQSIYINLTFVHFEKRLKEVEMKCIIERKDCRRFSILTNKPTGI